MPPMCFSIPLTAKITHHTVLEIRLGGSVSVKPSPTMQYIYIYIYIYICIYIYAYI